MDTKMIILTGIVLFTIDILFITYIFSNEYKPYQIGTITRENTKFKITGKIKW